jgi:DNA sulfur modification protein DndC
MVTQDKSMQAMVQNDEQKRWMQPILDFRNVNLSTDDRHLRDFRRMTGSLKVLNERLVHGPYLQTHRVKILRELLLTQKVIQQAAKVADYRAIELISIEELDEIRRIWLEKKGEIEDLVPKIYEEIFFEAYPGVQIEPVPLEPEDLELLRSITEELDPEASDELYRLTRSLLAVQFQNQQSNKRSKHLDQLQSVLQFHAFKNEDDSLAFALATEKLKQNVLFDEIKSDADGDDEHDSMLSD